MQSIDAGIYQPDQQWHRYRNDCSRAGVARRRGVQLEPLMTRRSRRNIDSGSGGPSRLMTASASPAASVSSLQVARAYLLCRSFGVTARSCRMISGERSRDHRCLASMSSRSASSAACSRFGSNNRARSTHCLFSPSSIAGLLRQRSISAARPSESPGSKYPA